MALRGVEDSETAEAAALLRVAMLIARAAPPGELFATAAAQAAGLLGVEAGAVVRFIGQERGVVVGVWRPDGIRAMPVNAELDFPRSGTALGQVCATGRAARVEAYEPARGGISAVMQAIGLRTTAAAPIPAGDEVWGALAASTAQEDQLPPGSEQRLIPLAQLLGLAVAHSGDREASIAAARRIIEAGDAARTKLEHILHEGAQQHLVALALKLRVACGQAPPDLAPLLEDALEDAVETGVELGELARALHPAVLTERGLPAALQALAARSAAPVHLRELPGRRFPAVVERTCYEIVALALDNCAAFAQAEEVLVLVMDERDRLIVEVRDDGVGGAAPRPGSALEGLRDRTHALGGEFTVDSPPGRGTVVRASFPV